MEPKSQITHIIQNKGYITIDEFMELAISSSPLSYYNINNPFNPVTGGDFITSPQISQMFGEMIAIWIYNQFIHMNISDEIFLVEFGPGTGVLMRDILRVLEKTQILPQIKILMLEKSPTLTKIQQDNLNKYENITWSQDYKEIPENRCIFISNEFLDIFPIKQYIKLDSLWHEIVVIIGKTGDLEFGYKDIPHSKNLDLETRYTKAKDNAIVEESPKLSEFIELIAENIKEYNSIMLALDYGYDVDSAVRSMEMFNPTLQAIKNHNYSDLLKDIGS
ncbi:MAG: SAM-dependent methyltransferase, partial [Rickettsiaceae bacterium]|nr:SAM-dependent methyltransferase [Rickettsiaceae bacterium]